MNNLERFVRDNREDFDSHDPSPALWAKIADKLPADTTNTADGQPGALEIAQPQPFMTATTEKDTVVRPLNGHRLRGNNGSAWRGWAVAASVAVLLLAGGFWWLNHRYGVAEQPDVVAVSPAYAKEFVQYARLIDTKQNELRQMTKSNPALYKQFAADLDRLESSYQNLRAELPQNPNQEVLIQAMIQNLQLQINLLNEQLRVIQRMKQQTHENYL
jgi:hypothetical protein